MAAERIQYIQGASVIGHRLQRNQREKIKRDEGAAAYCPVCLAEFIAAVNMGPDCGVSLEPYDAGEPGDQMGLT